MCLVGTPQVFLVAVVRPLLDNRPSERRTRRMFTTVLMPGR